MSEISSKKREIQLKIEKLTSIDDKIKQELSILGHPYNSTDFIESANKDVSESRKIILKSYQRYQSYSSHSSSRSESSKDTAKEKHGLALIQKRSIFLQIKQEHEKELEHLSKDEKRLSKNIRMKNDIVMNAHSLFKENTIPYMKSSGIEQQQQQSSQSPPSSINQIKQSQDKVILMQYNNNQSSSSQSNSLAQSSPNQSAQSSYSQLHPFSSSPICIEYITSFWHFCLSPRILLSERDALFSAEFLRLLSKCKYHQFTLISVIRPISLFCMKLLIRTTECEAKRIGVFLRRILEMITDPIIQREKQKEKEIEKLIEKEKKLSDELRAKCKGWQYDEAKGQWNEKRKIADNQNAEKEE
ncbi:MAG: hypothetical protein EZS28_027652, partial [Streblomastix strix]